MPDVNTTYVVTAQSKGGGCLHTDTVTVRADLVDNTIKLLGKANYCIGSGDSAVLVVQADSVQWYRNKVAIPGATKNQVQGKHKTGVYYAVLYGEYGCTLTTVEQQINIASVPVSGFTNTTAPNQCLFGNQFILKNNSSNAIGEMVYKWDFGDGNQATTKDVTYSYKKAGKYNLKLVVTSIGVCADSTIQPIIIYPNAVSTFTVAPTCIDLPAKIVKRYRRYHWLANKLFMDFWQRANFQFKKTLLTRFMALQEITISVYR
ncbi:MAG: PKD domain-containing protein [Ferruginibacter sp.]